ncbi:protein-L-isoaspartate O-methyltransferase family protein [Hyphomonas sp.]|uniref:protein-L-isoaspartate O-methyltransferase family protein n=1 Tax=Hyphomonas sp. TaxID=87 RepID=UPI003D2E93E1|tara:strand:- start:8821 stop:9474 length:654 start_codon:yes stop_codon:yes gene_type:complete
MAELIADPFRAARLVLHLRQEGITDDGVLKAMETIDRGAFVDGPGLDKLAFEDCILPIPCGQIVPRPAVTGQLLQALQIRQVREARILLVGVGSGYTAALAAQLGADVFAMDRYRRLCDAARRRMLELGLGNVAVRHGDGLFGWPERGPYDRILLTGAIDEVPDVLLQQLAKGGALIAPFRTADAQHLLRMGADGTQERLAIARPLPPLMDGASKAL